MKLLLSIFALSLMCNLLVLFLMFLDGSDKEMWADIKKCIHNRYFKKRKYHKIENIESNSLYGTMEQDDSSGVIDAAVPGEHITKASDFHYQQLLNDTFYDSIAKEFLELLEEANIEYNSEQLSEEYIEMVLKNNSDSISAQRLLLCEEPVKYIYHAMWLLDIQEEIQQRK